MDRFIACACDNDLQQLVISGDPTEEELHNTWISIKSQHIENLKDPQSMAQVDMAVELIQYEWKCQEVNTLLALLTDAYGDDVIEQLSIYDYDYPFTEDSYIADIDKVRAELGAEGLAFIAYKEQLLDSANDYVRPAKESYYMTITTLQKHLGLCHGLTPMKAAKELTVYEFGFSLKEYNQQARAVKPKQDVNSGYE